MLIDKHGMRWNNLEEWCKMTACSFTDCVSCPFCSKVNGTGLGCLEYIKKYSEEALKVALDLGIVREESPVRLCNILGVEVGEEFFFKDKKYKINKDGYLAIQTEFDLWTTTSDSFELEEMIQHLELIQKGPILTYEQKEELKKVKQMLPEADRVFWLNRELRVEMGKELKFNYKLNLDVEMPKGLDYRFEEEENNNGD